MLSIMNILAADDDRSDLITLVFVIAIVAFTVLARFLEQRLKSKTEQQSRDEDQPSAQRGLRPGERPPRERLKPVRSASPFESVQAPQAERPVEPEPEQFQPAIQPIAPAPPRRPQAPRPAPLPTRAHRQPQQSRPRTVEEEIGPLQAHMRKLEQLRARRMEMEAPPEADLAAIEARLLRIKPPPIATAPSGQRLQVNLVDLAAARSAIIYHEILSPPKALREGPEMWEL